MERVNRGLFTINRLFPPKEASISLGLIVRMDFVIESDLAALLVRLWARSGAAAVDLGAALFSEAVG